MHVIARIHTDLKEKFGIPRQSGLAPTLRGRIVFEPPYRSEDALRGLDQYSHLWLIWEFSDHRDAPWSPTVRPPRLGGNTRVGVFASRSPFRPNPIGLSCVRLDGIDRDGPDGPALLVSGADLKDGTPIFDIKPYLPYADCHPEARGGFGEKQKDHRLAVICPEHLLSLIPEDHRETALALLALDPRPSYQHDPERIYGMAYADLDIRFTVDGETLSVTEIRKA